MKNDAAEFVMLLNGLAKLTSFEPNDFIVDFYKSSLEPHGLHNVNSALRSLMKSIKRWPTVEEIESAMGILPMTPLSIEDIARDAVSRIWEAISDFGWNNPRAAKEYIGELGWKVVERHGGWARVTDVEEDQRGILTAQWRDLAITLYRFEQNGDSNRGPALPLSRALALIGDMSLDRED